MSEIRIATVSLDCGKLVPIVVDHYMNLGWQVTVKKEMGIGGKDYVIYGVPPTAPGDEE